MSEAAVVGVSVAAFLLTLGGLIAVRIRSEGKFEVKTPELLAPVVLVALILFMTGRIQEMSFGDFAISAAVEEASRSTVDSEVRRPGHLFDMLLQKELPVSGRTTYDVEAIAGESASVLAKRCEGLIFRLGRPYDRSQIERYLGEYPSLRYMILQDSVGKFRGLADLELIEAEFSERDYDLMIDALGQGNERYLRALPGFVSADDAITRETTRQDALRRLSRLEVRVVPVVDEAATFDGVVDREVLAASLIADMATRFHTGGDR